jgi:hypothetical protein
MFPTLPGPLLGRMPPIPVHIIPLVGDTYWRDAPLLRDTLPPELGFPMDGFATSTFFSVGERSSRTPQCSVQGLALGFPRPVPRLVHHCRPISPLRLVLLGPSI